MNSIIFLNSELNEMNSTILYFSVVTKISDCSTCGNNRRLPTSCKFWNFNPCNWPTKGDCFCAGVITAVIFCYLKDFANADTVKHGIPCLFTLCTKILSNCCHVINFCLVDGQRPTT